MKMSKFKEFQMIRVFQNVPILLAMYLLFITSSDATRTILKYPYVVFLRNRVKSQYLCSGSLLNLQWVLTSAGLADEQLKNTKSLIVTRLNQTREVDRIYYHQDYNARTFEHDIALILLKRSFEKTEYVGVSPIPIYPMDMEMIEKCAEVEVIGFDGKTLKSITYKVISNEECRKTVIYEPKQISFCATKENKVSCTNDIGGPAICEGFVFGIASYGCSPGVFTRIDQHLEFLRSVMGPSLLLRISTEEEVMRRNRLHYIIAVTSSALVLVGVIIILLCTLGVGEKLKCCSKKK